MSLKDEIRERQEILDDIQMLYSRMFDSELDELETLSNEELNDILIDLNMKLPIIESIQAMDQDLDYVNLQDMSMEELLDFQKRIEEEE